MYGDLGFAMGFLLWVAIISLPFAIWKWIEILIWLFSHVSINFN